MKRIIRSSTSHDHTTKAVIMSVLDKVLCTKDVSDAMKRVSAEVIADAFAEGRNE